MIPEHDEGVTLNALPSAHTFQLLDNNGKVLLTQQGEPCGKGISLKLPEHLAGVDGFRSIRLLSESGEVLDEVALPGLAIANPDVAAAGALPEC